MMVHGQTRERVHHRPAPRSAAARPARKSQQVLVLAGTRSGLFSWRTDGARHHFEARPPSLLGAPVADTLWDPSSGLLFAAVGGRAPGVYLSRDLGRSWTRRGGEIGAREFTLLAAGHPSACKQLYAAVAPALLYRSGDSGETWHPVHTFNEHPTRREWVDLGCGIAVRALVQDPKDPQRFWVAVSGAGVFRSDDGGLSFQLRTDGLPGHVSPLALYPGLGRCPHNLALGARGALWLQGHEGLYRSHDQGETWSERTRALPTRYGHALAAHPAEDAVWTVPESRETGSTNGDLALWKGVRSGREWERHGAGLPGRSHVHISPRALALDSLEPTGVYLGTSSGKLLSSHDGGRKFHRFAEDLPEVLSLRALLLDGEEAAS